MFSGRIFRSRWAALLWAGGVLWTAYDVADAAPPPAAPTENAGAATDATGEPVDAKELAIVANVMS